MKGYFTLITAVLLFLIIGLCIAGADILSSPNESALTLQIDNGSISNGSSIPSEFTCSGEGIQPDVSWDGIPPETKSLILILDDPDAPAGTFTHWIVYNISSDIHMIPEEFTAYPSSQGIIVGVNSALENDYFPPCPPSGQEHHYLFTLYALNSSVTGENLDREQIDAVINGHIIEKTNISAIFKK